MTRTQRGSLRCIHPRCRSDSEPSYVAIFRNSKNDVDVKTEFTISILDSNSMEKNSEVKKLAMHGFWDPLVKVSWLTKNVAERFYKDRVKLSHDDVIGVVLGNGNGDQLSTEVIIIKEEETGCCSLM